MMHIATGTEADLPGRDATHERARELSSLFYEEYPRLWAVAFVMIGDAHLAEEVVMDAFVKAFSSWRRLRRLDYPSGYLKKIVVNLCRSKLRRRSLESRVNALAHGRADRDLRWSDGGSATRLDVSKALSRLSPMQRTCVVLRYYDDMTDRQIAEVLDCSIGTVKSHIFRARKALARALEIAAPEDDR